MNTVALWVGWAAIAWLFGFILYVLKLLRLETRIGENLRVGALAAVVTGVMAMLGIRRLCVEYFVAVAALLAIVQVAWPFRLLHTECMAWLKSRKRKIWRLYVFEFGIGVLCAALFCLYSATASINDHAWWFSAAITAVIACENIEFFFNCEAFNNERRATKRYWEMMKS